VARLLVRHGVSPLLRLPMIAHRTSYCLSWDGWGTPSGSVTRLTPLPAAALRAPTRAEARCKTGTESLVSKNSMNSKFSMPGSYHQPNQAVLPYCFLAWSLPKQYAGCDTKQYAGHNGRFIPCATRATDCFRGQNSTSPHRWHRSDPELCGAVRTAIPGRRAKDAVCHPLPPDSQCCETLPLAAWPRL